MARHSELYDTHQRARFMRPDAARWMRPDAARWIRPDVARFLIPGTNPADVFPALDRKYSPTQRRIPAGQSGGGQWTDGTGEGGGNSAGVGSTGEETIGSAEGEGDVATSEESDGSENSDSNNSEQRDERLASSEKPELGRTSMLGIMARAAARVMEAYRYENFLYDLFGNKGGAVAVTTVDDRDIFGSNSTSATYTDADFKAAQDMREILITKYPTAMSVDNTGSAPNNALFHAETNVLLRAAQVNDGTLAGRSLDIYVDRELCRNCQSVIPLVGLELGNPTLTYVDPQWVYSITNGKITARSKR